MQTLNDQIQFCENKTVLVRVNYDVPLDNGQVGDTTRIENSLPTIKALLSVNAKVVLLAHAGRPDGVFKVEDSLAPIAQTLSALGNFEVNFVPFTTDFNQIKSSLKNGVNLLDNLRFFAGEEANDPGFAQSLSSLGEIYVNEAFAVCHRAHASMVGIPKYLTTNLIGISLEKELSVLNQVTKNPKKPLVVVIGGAKLETKEPLVNAFIGISDNILVGGKLIADFQSKTDLDPKITLGVLTPNGKDITKESAESFAALIMAAGTVVWNGTMGLFEEPENALGTQIVAQAINQTSAFTLVGGGDTETCLTKLNLEAGIDYISTGGGAMLEFLSHGRLVALDALL